VVEANGRIDRKNATLYDLVEHEELEGRKVDILLVCRCVLSPMRLKQHAVHLLEIDSFGSVTNGFQ
jgi:hypothetical protein